jgi:hypothetical protein
VPRGKRAEREERKKGKGRKLGMDYKEPLSHGESDLDPESDKTSLKGFKKRCFHQICVIKKKEKKAIQTRNVCFGHRLKCRLESDRNGSGQTETR